MDWVSKNRISGKPDSFIIASCLMYSLIDHPIITIKKTEVKNKMLEDFKFNIILDIAIVFFKLFLSLLRIMKTT